MKSVDLRQHGSGNLGATNVVRVLGAKIGTVVFLVDLLKGFFPVAVFPRMMQAHLTPHTASLWAIAFGVAAILGHARPVFLMGKGGGKGVATAAGVFLGLAWLPTVVVLVVWGLVLYVSGFVSLASLVAAALLPIVVAFWLRDLASPTFIASIIVAFFVFWTHRSNIKRLQRGEEHRFNTRGQVK